MIRMNAALVSLALLAGCAGAGAGSTRYTVVPEVQVKMKETKKRVAQVNYQAAPQDVPVTGSGGSK